jgi:hypothetical protein
MTVVIYAFGYLPGSCFLLLPGFFPVIFSLHIIEEMKKRKIDILYSDGNSTTDNRIKTFMLFTQTAREVFKYIDARLSKEAGISPFPHCL